MKNFSQLTPEEAANFIQNGQTIAFGGFTQAGSIKAISLAIAEKAKREHAAGRPFKIRVLTGGSTDTRVDGALAEAEAISYRMPYQGDPLLRQQINEGTVEYLDLHLSTMMTHLNMGIFGEIDYAIVEAAEVHPNGDILLTTGLGATATLLRLAKKVLIELNQFHNVGLTGLHDIYEPQLPPFTREIPIYHTSDRIGKPYVSIQPEKIVGIVPTNEPDTAYDFSAPDEVTKRIGENVAQFLLHEKKIGRIPESFLPVQAGVGSVSNALLQALFQCPEIPSFEMYSEILQDTVIDGIDSGKIRFASASGLGVSPHVLRRIYQDLPFYLKKLVLRPQEITNHPEVIRRLGVIGINTALEADIFGNVNSTHVLGSRVINGIGGSGDFARNCYISIFTTPSTAKNGTISSIVPYCSHLDHTEHDTEILITEFGIADLRGKGPIQRARTIIENCAHPDFRPVLREYLEAGNKGHIPFEIERTFPLHCSLKHQKTMRFEKN